MKLGEWDTLLSAVEHVATVLGLLAGGWWAFHRFVLGREKEWNLNIDAAPVFHPYAADAFVLSVSIIIRNVGKVKISPAGNGCWFSLKSFPLGMSIGDLPHWNEGRPIVDNLNVIPHANPDHMEEMNPVDDNYVIEPGAEFVETVNIVVPHGTLLMAEIGFTAAPDEKAMWTYRVWRSPGEGLQPEPHVMGPGASEQKAPRGA